MQDCNKLIAALFGNAAREHIDIKFFMGGAMEIDPDELCDEAVKMIQQMDAAEGDEGFEEDFEQREAADLLKALAAV